jgi:hypothetical protein
VTPIHYKGIVWCVKVPTGAFVARRNGKVFITGNSGFPKATRIDTQIDKAAGKLEEREIVGYKKLNSRDKRTYIPTEGGGYHGVQSSPSNGMKIELPATDLARAWQGHRYGLQALKPAVEPIIVAQKPYSGKPIDSIVDTGAGALNIDGGRVATGDNLNGGSYSESGKAGPLPGDSREGAALGMFRPGAKPSYPFQQPIGRWPPNFCLVHMPPTLLCQSCQAVHPIQPVIEVCDCGGELERVEGCKRVGVKRVKGIKGGKEPEYVTDSVAMHMRAGYKMTYQDYADPDGKETVADWDCRESCPARRLGEQSGESKSGGGSGQATLEARGRHFKISKGDYPAAGLGGYGDKGTAARFYPQADWEHEVAEQLAQADPVHYCPKAAKRERNNGLDDFYWRRDKASPTGFVRVSQEEWETLPKRQRARGNIHSTVKPISLLVWLCKLLSPPEEYAPRRLLIPFAGSGSEICAAVRSGCWEEVVGIEFIQDYVDISLARSQFWQNESSQQLTFL